MVLTSAFAETNRSAALVFLCLLAAAGVVAGAGLAPATVVTANETQSGTAEGTAELEVDLPEDTLDAGETSTVELFITTDGELDDDEEAHPEEAVDRVTEAESVSVDANATHTDDIEVETNEQPVGTIEDGETAGPVGFDVDVDEEASGTYEIDVELEYTDATVVEYEFEDGDFFIVNETTETVTEETTVEVTVDGEARFRAFTIGHDVGIGEEGDLLVRLLNEGEQGVTDATVTATAPDDDVTLGGTATSEAFIGEWDARETQRFDLRASVADDATERAYPIEFDIEFEDEDGELQEETVTASFTPDSRQDVEVTNITHDVGIDDQGMLELTVQNGDDRELTDATVVVESEEPTVQFNPEAGGTPSSEAPVGDLVIFEEATAQFRVGTTADATERPYQLTVTVEYEDDSGERQTTQPTTVDFVPQSEQQFTVDSVDHSVGIGDDGILELELENEGPRNATDTTVTVESQDAAVQIGSTTDEPIDAGDVVIDPDDTGSVSSEAFVGDWQVEDTTNVRFVAAATDDAIERQYPLSVTIDYEDENGTEMTERTTIEGFQPIPEQEFAIVDTDSSLRVGEDGDVEAELVNTGPQTVENVVLTYDDEIDNVFAREREHAVESLEPGESVPVSFRFGVTAEAVEGPRAMEFVVRYRNEDDDVRVSDSLDVVADVQPQRDRFDVETVDESLTAGSADVVSFEVTNQADETYRNIRMKLFTNDPLDSDDTEAFISSLDSGETTTVEFDLSVDDGAVPRTYPVSMDFQFDDERNETQLSRTTTAPVDVAEPEDGGISLGLLAIIGLVVGGAVIVGARRYGTDSLLDLLPFGGEDTEETDPVGAGDERSGSDSGATVDDATVDGTVDPLDPGSFPEEPDTRTDSRPGQNSED